MSDSLQLQRARLPCPSPSPGVLLLCLGRPAGPCGAARGSLVGGRLRGSGGGRGREPWSRTCPVTSALRSEPRPVPQTTYTGPSAPMGSEPRDPASLRWKISGGKSDSRKFQKAKLKFAALATVYVAFTLYSRASLVAQMVKHLPTMGETWVQSLGREDPLEKGMATHSSILAWEIPWMEEAGRLQSRGSQRVGHKRATSLAFFLRSSEIWCLFLPKPWHAFRRK